MDEELKRNLTEKALWLRAIFMVLFYVILNMVEIVVGCIGLVQLALSLFTRKPNDNLIQLGSSLATYTAQITEFLTFTSDTRPYPFSTWPTPTATKRPKKTPAV